jgi:hypothetical protein
MKKREAISLLYTIYSAGFSHGFNEKSIIPEHGTFEAFNRLIVGESPTQDKVFYDIKYKIEKLLENFD